MSELDEAEEELVQQNSNASESAGFEKKQKINNQNRILKNSILQIHLPIIRLLSLSNSGGDARDVTASVARAASERRRRAAARGALVAQALDAARMAVDGRRTESIAFVDCDR